MGTSNWQNISYNIDLVKKLDPRSILDIGAGFGRWGILFREFLEIWGERNYTGKWNRVIDGVEIFSAYIKPYHSYFYNNIYNEDALAFMRRPGRNYDLINCGDVIEHFRKEDATELIDLCLNRCRHLLINIPIGKNWKQEAVNNNEYERHLSFWKVKDFEAFDHSLIQLFEDVELRKFAVVLLSKEPIDLNLAYGRHFRKKSILKNKLGLGNVVKLIEKRK